MLNEVDISYVPLSTLFTDYTNDCWTYDGRSDTHTHTHTHTVSLYYDLSLIVHYLY